MDDIENYAVTNNLDALKVSVHQVQNSVSILKALQAASHFGHLQCVQYLLPLSDMKRDAGSSVWMAAHNNHQECVKCLLPRSHVSDISASQLMKLFIVEKKIDLLKLLAEHQKYVPNILMRLLVENGNVQCFTILLPFCSVQENNSQLLALAVVRQNHEMVDLLYPLSNPHDALELLRTNQGNHQKGAEFLISRIKSDEEKTILQKELKNTGVASVTRKI